MKTMKKFKEFVNEDLTLISDTTKSSIVQKGSKYDILKISNDEEYSDKEIMFYNFMKKDSNLFCKFFKISKEKVLTEQLDVKNFKKSILKEFSDCDNKLQKQISELELNLKDKTLNIEEIRNYSLELEKFLNFQFFLQTFFQVKGLANIKHLVKNYSENDFIVFLNTNFKEYKILYQYFDKCYKIINFFKNITKLTFMVDLHINNFGFRKGTHEIICFDPVYVYRKT